MQVSVGGAGQATMSASGPISFTTAPTEYTFFVRRAAPGAATVPLVVTDGCGAWPTFVGMGTGVQ